MTLSVWHDGTDWVVAESAEDAVKIVFETSGYGADEMGEFVMMADDSALTMRHEDEDDETMTCAEWVTKNGRGFLGSTEF